MVLVAPPFRVLREELPKHLLRNLSSGRLVADQIGRSRLHIHMGFPRRARGRHKWRCVGKLPHTFANLVLTFPSTAAS